MSNGTDQTQSTPVTTAIPLDSRPRKRASPGDDWLPPGWTTQVRVRTSGVKAGMVDKFYFEPVTGRKFRSRNEVSYYLEHGAPKKPIMKAENGYTDSEHSQGQGSNKQQTQPNGANEQPQAQPQPPLNFDFLNVPEKVIWTGTNDSEEAWWPSIGDHKIPESISQDWDRAFTLVTTQNNRMF